MPARPKFRKLQHNAGTEHPSNLLFFDCESVERSASGDGWHRELSWRLACAVACRIESGRVTRRQAVTCHAPEDLWEFVESRQDASRPLWVFAHNLHFDLTQARFWDRLESREYDIGPIVPGPGEKRVTGKREWKGSMCIRRAPYFLKLMGRRGPVVFCDTLNYFSSPLVDLGAAVGRPKLPMPSVYTDGPEWEAYCMNDVEIIEELVTRTLIRWKEEKCGVWATTAAGLAVHSWRHTPGREDGLGQAPDVTFKESEEQDEYEREGYYGGYVGAFYLGAFGAGPAVPQVGASAAGGSLAGPGEGPYYHLDVRSLYPFVMRNNNYPCNRVDSEVGPSVAKLALRMKTLDAIASVRINCSDEEFPMRRDGCLTYCTGTYVTTLAGPELRRALACGAVASVGWALFYATGPIFRDWVDYWWERRKKAINSSDSVDSLACKLVMNSLSGKFAQKPGRWVDREAGECMYASGWGHWYRQSADGYHEYRAIGGNVQRWEDGGTTEYGFPAISAFITAYGREYMLTLRRTAGARAVLHQATDSLIVTRAGYERLCEAGYVGGADLGTLKVEGTTTDGAVYGPNWYECDGVVTRAGWWGGAELGIDGNWYRDTWETCETNLRANPDGVQRISTHVMRGAQVNAKGFVDPDGFVWPLVCADPLPEHTSGRNRRLVSGL